MSVELYPDHKAILNFHKSLTVLEVDLLSYLTTFLAQDTFAHRQFNLYAKPTLHQSVFDFILVEPKHAIYIIQTPENIEQFKEKQAALDQNLHPSFQNEALIKTVHYIYHEDLYENLAKNEDKHNFITPADFDENTKAIQQLFEEKTDTSERLTMKESRQIARVLNPNTNIRDFIPKTVPGKYEEYVKSKSQSKQKFKGTEDVEKTILLIKRIVNSAKRLNDHGQILVIAGDPSKVTHLKDLITAEDGRSLQELGIDIENFEDLTPPDEKYNALFIDEGGLLEVNEYRDLLENYLIEMTPENDYEYVVMANENNLPKVPQIFGRFITLKKDPRYLEELLSDSREIFLEILKS